MKFPLSWLCEFVPISDSPERLAELLSMAGLEVEGIETFGDNLKGIITGKIEKIDPHPNADKLVITTIFDGKKRHQIVTGASNVSKGDVVPVCLPGSVIASGMTLKSTSLRGVESHGMLCSEKELGVSEKASGIWILPPETELGLDFISYASLCDTVFDVAILPNRGDCQSVWGLAREISALTGQTLALPKISVTESDVSHSFSVCSKSEHCPLYIGRYLTGISNMASPVWMQRRLALCDLRAQSLIVDVTNYVLLETGHPLHAFDEAKFKSKKISVELSKKGSSLTTLDGHKRPLQDGQLLILNDKTPVALAGVMGAQNTEVSDDTQNIFLEAAFFSPHVTRRSATLVGLRTDSSVRFEKGTNIESTDLASLRASELLQQFGGATVSKNVCVHEDKKSAYFKSRTLPFSLDAINYFLGSSYKSSDVKPLLKRLGFTVAKNQVQIPAWRRADIEAMPCIAEEISRLLGFDSIPATLPRQALIQDSVDPLVLMTQRTEDFLVSNGLVQVNTYPMVSQASLDGCLMAVDSTSMGLANPLSPELAFMRPSLLPSLLQICQHHHARQQRDCAFFEVGTAFSPDQEDQVCAFMLTGNFFESASTASQRDVNALLNQHCQGLFSQWLAFAKLSVRVDRTDLDNWAHPVQSQAVFLGQKKIGTIGLIHPKVSAAFGITEPVAYCEISLRACVERPREMPRYMPFSSFPHTRRDMACLVPHELAYSEIKAIIDKCRHKTVIDVGVFDVFESESIGTDKRSIGIYVLYQGQNKTLSDDKVNKIHQRLCDQLQTALPLQIR